MARVHSVKNKKHNQNGQRKLQIRSSMFDSAAPKRFCNSKCNTLIHFGLNMHATGHAKLTITILDVTQPLNFPSFWFLIGWFAQLRTVPKLMRPP